MSGESVRLAWTFVERLLLANGLRPESSSVPYDDSQLRELRELAAHDITRAFFLALGLCVDREAVLKAGLTSRSIAIVQRVGATRSLLRNLASQVTIADLLRLRQSLFTRGVSEGGKTQRMATLLLEIVGIGPLSVDARAVHDEKPRAELRDCSPRGPSERISDGQTIARRGR